MRDCGGLWWHFRNTCFVLPVFFSWYSDEKSLKCSVDVQQHNTKDDISIHEILFHLDSGSLAVKRRHNRIFFVNLTRRNWSASKHWTFALSIFSARWFYTQVFFQGSKLKKAVKRWWHWSFVPVPKSQCKIPKERYEQRNNCQATLRKLEFALSGR